MSNQDPHNESGKFYSYEKRQGILPISWENYFGLCKGLALAISAYDPEIILGVARGGLIALPYYQSTNPVLAGIAQHAIAEVLVSSANCR